VAERLRIGVIGTSWNIPELWENLEHIEKTWEHSGDLQSDQLKPENFQDRRSMLLW
jgi:hypothetical protein